MDHIALMLHRHGKAGAPEDVQHGTIAGKKIRQAFLNLERDTVYTRFFGYKADVSDAELGRITGADFERAVALLVTIGTGEDEVVTSRGAGSAAC